MARSISPYEQYGIVTPATDAALRTHIFTATDTISSLADKYLGDWRLWRLISEKNSIGNVRNIAIGTELIIPALPLETGRYEST